MTTTSISTDQIVSFPRAVQQSVDSAGFRQALSQLAAGVSVVTTSDQHGTIYGLTATSVTALSLDPPLVLVCISNQSRASAILKVGAGFAIHFLAANQEWIANRFARPEPDKFAGVAYHLSEGGVPLLDGALVSVECAPYCCYPGGDHTIVVGRVINVQACDVETLPLVYFRRQFTQISQSIRP